MTEAPQLRSTPCHLCGELVWRERLYLFGKEMFTNARMLCPGCAHIHEEIEEKKRKLAAWEIMVQVRMPDEYIKATPDKIPPCYSEAYNWGEEGTQDRFGGGIGLIGGTGRGKSSALACVILKQKRHFSWFTGTAARKASTEAAMADKDEDMSRLWRSAFKVPILVLDDISQGVMSQAWASSLYEILEHRLTRNRPVFWTSQFSLSQFALKIARQNGGDTAQADAITRRLSCRSLILS